MDISPASTVQYPMTTHRAMMPKAPTTADREAAAPVAQRRVDRAVAPKRALPLDLLLPNLLLPLTVVKSFKLDAV